MMELEKRLASTDLNQFKEAPKQIMAKEILRYRNFTPKAALSKMNRVAYSDSTLISYLNQGFRYLETGYVQPHKGFEPIAQYIDQYKNRISALTPSEADRRIKRKRWGKGSGARRIPTCKKQQAVAQQSVTESFVYMVQIDGFNRAHIFTTEKECNAFVDGVKAAAPHLHAIISTIKPQIIKAIA